MEYSAIFHDMDKRFSYAVDKDLFVIRVQVKKDDMKEVILHYEDKYNMERKEPRKTVADETGCCVSQWTCSGEL